MLSLGSDRTLVIDSSPLIYLAKLEALELFRTEAFALMSDGVRREVLVPQAAVRFPEMARVDRAISEGRLVVTELDEEEREAADGIGQRIPGLGVGERESIALADARRLSVVLHDRRAGLIARAMGVEVIGPVDLLFERTVDDQVLRDRLRAFAGLVDMRIDALHRLLELVKERPRW